MDVTQVKNRRGEAPWLLFMFQLPSQSASQRVTVWRKLRKYGVLAWRNSAYILPHTSSNLEKFQWLAAAIRKYRGEASVIEVARIEDASHREIIALFNKARAQEYEKLVRDLRLASRGVAAQGPVAARFARLNRRFGDIAAIDFFGCGKRQEAEELLKKLEARSRPTAGIRLHMKAGRYRGRVWMTRPRPEVDRVGSAWLIRHFLDPRARFVFSSDPQAHPGALRFDMFEGEFTHVGDHCTFEVLVKHFGLRDQRVRWIAQIVHDADLGDNKFGRSESRAMDMIFKGLAKTDLKDEEILQRGFDIYDALYLTVEG